MIYTVSWFSAGVSSAARRSAADMFEGQAVLPQFPIAVEIFRWIAEQEQPF